MSNFSPTTIPWHFPNFTEIANISPTCVKFPDISGFFRKVVTIYTIHPTAPKYAPWFEVSTELFLVVTNDGVSNRLRVGTTMSVSSLLLRVDHCLPVCVDQGLLVWLMVLGACHHVQLSVKTQPYLYDVLRLRLLHVKCLSVLDCCLQIIRAVKELTR